VAQRSTRSREAADHAAPLRILCVTLWADRPEAETFIGLKRNGCDVRVFCMPDSPQIPRLREAGIPVTPVAIRKRLDLEAIKALRRELASSRYDILYLLHNRAVSNGLIAARGHKELKILAYRGIVGNVKFLNPVSWLRYLNPRLDRVICVAEAVRSYFLNMRLLGFRLPPERFVTIHKGHDLAWYADRPADLSEFRIPSDAFVVGCVANLRPRKGVEVLVDAFGALPPDLPIYLLLVGHMHGKKLDRAIASNRNAERIRRAGFRKDAPAVIAACDASVLPSLKREGLPKTVIESMAYAVAPIVTNVGGSPELVADGGSGLVVPPGDAQALAGAILRLHRDRALCKRLGENARQRIASEFNIRTTVEKYLELCRELLGREERGGAPSGASAVNGR
jgi:glycosyltransferase involved in cell wall biosynthesis